MISRELPPLERVEQLAALYELASTVGRATELDVIYQAAFRAIDRGLRTQKASILLFDPDGVIRFKAWRGLSDEYRAATEGHTPWQPDHSNPTPVLIEDVLLDHSLDGLRDVITGEGIRALGFFPLVSHGRLLGKFMIYYSEPHVFTEDETWMAELIAGNVASAIERQLGVEALQASEEQFSKAFHASPVGLSIVTASDRRFVDINDAFLNLLGYTREEVIGRTVEELSIWADGERDRATEMLTQRGFTRHTEAKLRTKAGEDRSVLGSMEVITVRGETCVLSMLVDITDRRRSEDVLAFQKALLQAQSEASTDGILVVSPSGEMSSYNRRFVEMWNIPASVMESRSDDAAIKAVLEKLVDPGEFTGRITYLYDHPEEESRDRLSLKDGRVFDRHTTPLVSPEGEYWGRVWYFRDITESLRQEERDQLLAAAGEVLASSLEHDVILPSLADLLVQRFADLVWIHVQEGESIRRMAFAGAAPAPAGPYIEMDSVNASRRDRDHPVARVIETRKPELYTDMTESLLATAARDPAHLEMLKSFDIRSAIVVPIVAGRVAKGTLTFARSSQSPQFTIHDQSLAEDLAGRVAVSLENARLYEESLRMQQDLRRLNEAKDEFLGMVSHELRTPITTIYGGARVLRDRPGITEADRGELVEDIIDESERLRRLIEDLLVLARVELGEELLTEPVLIPQTLQAQVETLQKRVRGRDVQLDIDSDLPPAMASQTYLEQTFRNLIDNALKYSPPGSAILLSAHRDGNELLIGVTTSGDEISAEDVERMFERFYRAKGSANRTGAGIGLTVCRRLVEAQKGRIWAEARKGGGLSVFFTVPACLD